ncbi:FadR/GntR family transcriptional regulator [Cellulomonas fimi]|uniref:FadR family transcriptional regulator n=1 Tax=Cellulomonas fimi TaxID=1708 RepID=A0A7Y0M0R6_CELFI|nr:FadR/GntR family transcriptional regulator [Cellulomonas fimi]NMR21713.1 FadR family transcriptional regulator [Cellulomonas fimi]
MTDVHAIEPVRRLKVADSVAAQLQQLIVEGQFPPGSKLPAERVLAEEFGVGRSSMREALRMVESSGMIRTAHGVGVFVTSTEKQSALRSELLIVDDYTVAELFEARVNLEGQSAGLAAKRVSRADGERLRKILKRSEAPELTDEEFIECDAEFHLAIAAASQNRLLVKMHETIRPLFRAYSRRVIQLPGRRDRAQAGHLAIVEAVTARRSREARSAAVAHIREVERDILDHLQGGQG